MCPFLFVLEHSGTNGNDFMCMKPVSRAKGLKMNLDQQSRLVLVSLDTYDNPEFAGLPLSVDVLMNMKAKCFAVHSHEITDFKHL